MRQTFPTAARHDVNTSRVRVRVRRGLRHVHQPAQVDVDHLVPLLQRRGLRRPVEHDPGRVRQRVEPSALDVTFRETTTIRVERPVSGGAAVEIIDRDPNPFLATVGLRP
ncbi:hypothetical protein ABGB17_35005 [Sphaerisporangium sp. B11E5]|uniref:hypothetical protein n=1 Tax=Sphaerisporangium sp. B11E5 TaxID=3153563 RepID=UPI00325C9E3A